MKTMLTIMVLIVALAGCTTDAWRKMEFGNPTMILDQRDRDFEACERDGVARYGWFPETIAPELTPRFRVFMERCMERRGYQYQAGGYKAGRDS